MSSYGYFSEDGSQYVITDPQTKRTQMNYLWNRSFLLAVNQFGAGNGAYQNQAAFYISPEGRGSMIKNGNRYLYIKDERTQTVWNPGWYPSRTPLDSYRCVHGQTATLVEGTKDGVRAEWTLFVGPIEAAECWIVKLYNGSKQPCRLSVYPFVEFSLDGYPANSGWHSWVRAYHREENQLLYAENNAEERPHPFYNGFMATDSAVAGYDTSRDSFLGTYGNFQCPDGIMRGMGNSRAACEDMVAAYEIRVELQPGEEKTFHVVVGISNCIEEASAAAGRLLEPGRMEAELAELNRRQQRELALATVATPDTVLNYFADFWLKKQIRLCAEIGRGAGKGFRDQLQDAWAMAAFSPKTAREKIKEALEQIYHTGRCVRGWLPLKDRNCSDGPTWVAPAINAYLKETGDYGFLREPGRYLDEGEDTVWEHILTTVRYSSEDTGPHGLVHIHAGDWNDSLNGMGKAGIGESVWTSIALYHALEAVTEMADKIVKAPAIVREMQERAGRIRQAVNESGWDGAWYLAGYNDEGQKVGSVENEEGRIYMNPQVWAVMTGIAQGERKELCLHSMEKYLETEYGALTLYPPYTKYRPDIGRLTGFVPGIWENGTPYCHGGAFKAVMECMDGRGDKAYETMKKILPDSLENPSDLSGAEPYVLTNMYFGPDNPRAGQTQFSWVTGSAGWIYRAITQYMLGFYPEYDSIRIRPALPRAWKSVKMIRYFRGCTYHVTINNEKAAAEPYALAVDGSKQETPCIPVFKDGGEHQIVVYM